MLENIDKLSYEALMIYTNLSDNVENLTFDKNGSKWGIVYLDNARPKGVSDKIFRSYLSVLSKQGLYRISDGKNFGEVLIE